VAPPTPTSIASKLMDLSIVQIEAVRWVRRHSMTGDLPKIITNQERLYEGKFCHIVLWAEQYL
jgi:hypothetical protein